MRLTMKIILTVLLSLGTLSALARAARTNRAQDDVALFVSFVINCLLITGTWIWL